jgi:hypothetical protein
VANESNRVNFFSFGITGSELRVLHLLGRCSTTRATPPALFVLDIFEIGSLKLFA